jgi:transposase InsO family protein
MESFFHTLKTELVYNEYYFTREQASQSLFDYIETFYNPERIHSSLGYFSSKAFESLIMQRAS